LLLSIWKWDELSNLKVEAWRFFIIEKLLLEILFLIDRGWHYPYFNLWNDRLALCKNQEQAGMNIALSIVY
jgi:hypothetical protein